MKLPGKGMSWKEFFAALRSEYKFDRLNDAAAALTFFGVLALFPFLIFLVSLASVLIDPAQIQALVPDAAAGPVGIEAAGPGARARHPATQRPRPGR